MKVLVVDDNEDNRELAVKILRHAGHEVQIAVDGREALAKVEEYRPDLVLMDLAMPGKNGWDATREIRRLTGLEALPIIALTAHALRADDRKRAEEAGCTDYITKPFDRAELLDKVRLYGRKSTP